MTQQEADKIAELIAGADSGCPDCVGAMCIDANYMDLGFKFSHAGKYPAVVKTTASPKISKDSI